MLWMGRLSMNKEDNTIKLRKQYDEVWQEIRELFKHRRAIPTIHLAESKLAGVDNEVKALALICIAFCGMKHTLEAIEEEDLRNELKGD